jgi:hypothetical protein
MCIFSKAVDKVANTRIFVCPANKRIETSTAGAGKRRSATPLRQLTVYSNQVELPPSKKPTSMILPVPIAPSTRVSHPDTCGVIVHDMQEASNRFFDMLMTKLTRQRVQRTGMKSKLRPALRVHRAGAYRYSIVPTVADFKRVDDDVFKIGATSELYSLLSEHYSSNFAFLVCIIDESATMRPIAYEHDRLHGGHLFVPT